MEWEIQKQIQEHSRQLVQDVLQRSANRIMPPTPLEAVRASLSQCFQKALATPQTEPAPPPEQPRGQTKGESPKYSLADPFAGINPPPPEVLKESNPDHLPEAEQPHVWNGHRRKRSGGAALAHGEKPIQSAAGPVVLNPPGMFPRSEADSPTRPDLNLQVSRRLRHLPQS